MSADPPADPPDTRGTPGQAARPGDAARRLLARARRTPPPPRRTRRPARPENQAWSGAHPDARDPEPVASSVAHLVQDRHWQRTLDAAGLLPRWGQIVGPDVAAHCRPERLVAGELTVVAETTAWATQLRLMSRQLLTAIAREVGPDVVRRLRVHGPTAPDWRHGPLRVTGRGPRDTYG